MNRCASFFPARAVRAALSLSFAALAFGALPPQADAYSLNGKTWPSGTITFQVNLGSPTLPLLDGNTSWYAAVAPAFDMWNQNMSRVQLASVSSSAGSASNDRINSVVFANSVYGQSFGSGTLAVTYYMMQGSNLIEADVLFNRAMTFNSYRGVLQFLPTGYANADIRRVFLHEVGHALGLNHFEGTTAAMNAMISNLDNLTADDIAGVQAMYGAPAPPPPPPPVASHLANISTRMKVGLNDDVIIGGFFVKGSTPKQMILRAVGPSLGAKGVAGAMSDTVLELYDSAGAMIAQNDDWQSGGQASAIVATGVAPSHPFESALIATLAPGSYTAIVRGWNNAQGVAMVEGYALDTTSTRLVNLSTRGRIGLGDEVLIGGIIVNGSAAKPVIVRAIGPSFAGSVNGTINNTMLEVFDSAGRLVASNDDWGSGAQRDQIIATTVPPSHPLESAVVVTLAPGSYTAIVRGVNGSTGVGLVEVFDLEP
ncbi:hypothetical protein BH20VER1_BH20VER1_02500 [soil metagenome]